LNSISGLFTRLRARGGGELELHGVEGYISELRKDLDEVKKVTMDLAERVDKLSKSLAELFREVSKLSDSFGFIVEDVARSLLPTWLYVNTGVLVKNLNRAFFELGNRVVEVDFYGEGVDREGNNVVVFGEAKARIHGEDVKNFYEKVQNVIKSRGSSKAVMLMYGLYVHPSAIQEALRRGIVVVSPYVISMPGEGADKIHALINGVNE